MPHEEDSMKREFDSNGRTIYRFSHSVCQGGTVYIHKVTGGSIQNKGELKDVLKTIALEFKLIDTTIKVYDTLFFLFFFIPKSLTPQVLIDAIQRDISPFATWDEEYFYTGTYDLQEKQVREDILKWGFDYEKG